MAKAKRLSPAETAFDEGVKLVAQHPLFGGLLLRVRLNRSKDRNPCTKQCWLRALPSGHIWVHPTRLAQPQHWAYQLAHALLYFAWGFFQPQRAYWREWNAACDVVIARFLRDMRFAQPPDYLLLPEALPGRDEEGWYQEFYQNGIPAGLQQLGPSQTESGMLPDWGLLTNASLAEQRDEWKKAFASCLQQALLKTVEKVSDSSKQQVRPKISIPLQRAQSWFMSHFSLLASLVASFELIEDTEICRREDIRIAAVSEYLREIYINPMAGLSEPQLRFVLAHEVLHAGLRHSARCLGRDRYLWNIACDFVINDWLIELEVGTPPPLGLLHDLQFRGESAEAVYDRIVVDLRRYRKLMTLAGGQCDMLEDKAIPGQMTDLDEFYRNQLAKGLALHEQQNRGYLPAGLIEEIRALSQPPIGWDVELARWFDAMFPPLETRRTYTRLSRRQSATPDIVRPARFVPPELRNGRVFGVVLDTSGSMDRSLLGKALGAIASYSMARDVAAARVIFCDAQAYDAGYLAPQDIASRVQVKGRGGTVLQPGIDLLQSALDFPPDGPILLITDGYCDPVHIQRKHAFIIPQGARLPFVPQGPVFRMA